VTHVRGDYLKMDLTRGRVMRGDNGAPGTPSHRWGRSETTVDLTTRKPMTEAQAIEIVDGMLVKAGPRLGYTNGLELTADQITRGGVRANLSLIRAGQMVRLHGVRDELTGTPYHDIVIGEVRHEAEAQTVYIEPLGLAARNLTAVLEGEDSTALVG